MSYLILTDYKKQIQSDNLQQVIGSDAEVLRTAELQAIEEAYGYLVQKYITDEEFTETYLYNPAVSYKLKDRIYLDASPYNPNATYALGTLVLQGGNVYSCSNSIDIVEPFTQSNWVLLGPQYTLFY